MEISKFFLEKIDRGGVSKFGKISMLTGVDFSKLFPQPAKKSKKNFFLSYDIFFHMSTIMPFSSLLGVIRA